MLRTQDEISGDGPFYKLLNESEQHYGMKYATGVNTDVLPFNPSGVCSSGGLYFFSRRQFVSFWWHVPPENVVWLRMVSFTPNSLIWDEGDKMKTNEFVLGERQLFFIPDDLCLAAVQDYGMALQFVKEQTSEICLAAVRQTGRSLQFVKAKTPEICLEAVRNFGRALEFVKDPTYEMCVYAIQNDLDALQFVPLPVRNEFTFGPTVYDLFLSPAARRR